MHFIDGQVYDHINEDKKGGKLGYEGGRIFGKFQKMMGDISPKDLHVIIPNFQYTPVRFNDFLKALEEDRKGRAKYCKKEINFFLSREYIKDKSREIIDDLPLRVTHNDTKINNVIFSVPSKKKEKGVDREKAKAVIDLDTVMPGTIIYDIGDLLRSSACTSDEDLKKIYSDLKQEHKLDK